MEAVGAAGGIVSLVDFALRTTNALTQYTKSVRHAGTDRRLLIEESENLAHLLTRLRDRIQQSNEDARWRDAHRSIIKQFEAAYADFTQALDFDPVTGKPRDSSRFKRFKQAATWNFTKAETWLLGTYRSLAAACKRADLG